MFRLMFRTTNQNPKIVFCLPFSVAFSHFCYAEKLLHYYIGMKGYINLSVKILHGFWAINEVCPGLGEGP